MVNTLYLLIIKNNQEICTETNLNVSSWKCPKFVQLGKYKLILLKLYFKGCLTPSLTLHQVSFIENHEQLYFRLLIAYRSLICDIFCSQKAIYTKSSQSYKPILRQRFLLERPQSGQEEKDLIWFTMVRSDPWNVMVLHGMKMNIISLSVVCTTCRPVIVSRCMIRILMTCKSSDIRSDVWTRDMIKLINNRKALIV